MGRTWTLQAGKAAFSPETIHFEITDVILCVKGLRDVKILKCCCEQSSAEFMTQHVPGLYWKGKGKHFKRVFRMHMKPKLHKHVHSCLQPISKSLRFLVCCSHTWENPQCRVFPNTPLNHRGWHKIKAFRLEFLGYASYHLLSLLYSVRTWNGCYSLVTINTVCLAMPERHLGLCPLCCGALHRWLVILPRTTLQQRQATFCHSCFKEITEIEIAVPFWSDPDSNLNWISPL